MHTHTHTHIHSAGKMVNKFGDCDIENEEEFLQNVQIIRKVIITSGKYIDYYAEIQDSIRLGYMPYRMALEKSPTTLFTFDNKVFCVGSPGEVTEFVNEEVITKSHHLIYWKEVDKHQNDNAIALKGDVGSPGVQGKRGIAGPAGPIGKIGKPGPTGGRGEKGEKGDPGIQGVQGDQGERGEKGDTGPAGPVGKVGPAGPRGNRGEKGERGEQGIQGIKGDRGERGEKGEKGDVGKQGEKGDDGKQGKTGPPAQAVDYAYIESLIAKSLPNSSLEEILKNIKKDAFSRFWYRRNEDVKYNDEDLHINRWLNQIEGSNWANQTDSDLMPKASKEKHCSYRYISFYHSALKMFAHTTRDHCMFIVYRLNTPIYAQLYHNNYMIGCNTQGRLPYYKTISFRGDRTSLNITNSKEIIKLTTFPKTNPCTNDIWHVLCVEWVTEVVDKSSVWVNGYRVATFTNFQDPGLNNNILLGALYSFDQRGFRGDIIHLEMYQKRLSDIEKYVIQKELCTTYCIKMDE